MLGIGVEACNGNAVDCSELRIGEVSSLVLILDFMSCYSIVMSEDMMHGRRF